MITIDERTGKERKQPYAMLIKANNTDDARTIYNKVMSKSVVDYEIKKNCRNQDCRGYWQYA